MIARSTEVVVLGGGPAGLMAAWSAARAGHEVVLVERSDVVGGLAASFDVAGIRVDLGSHRLHPATDPGLLGELWSLLGRELQQRRRQGRIHLDGRWIGFPQRPVDLLREAPPSLALGAARDLLLAPWRRSDGAGDSFVERARAGLGPTLTDRFYAPYARKIWGIDPSELSGELFRRRVAAGSTGGLARRMLARAGSDRRTFWYPAGGFGRIPEVVAEAAVAAGAEIRTATGAVHLVGSDAGPITLGLDDGSELTSPVVLSTLPGPTLVRLAGAAAPAEVRAAAGRLQHRGAVLVYLVVPRRPYGPVATYYLPDPALAPARVSEPTRYRDSVADPPDRTVICAEIPATVGDDRWAAPDVELVAGVVDALCRVGLADPTPIADEVCRMPFVYPVYRAGFEADQAEIERWSATVAGLVVLGRQGLFAHDNTHHAMAMGAAAAGCVRAGGRFDAARWATERERFRSHVVED